MQSPRFHEKYIILAPPINFALNSCACVPRAATLHIILCIQYRDVSLQRFLCLSQRITREYTHTNIGYNNACTPWERRVRWSALFRCKFKFKSRRKGLGYNKCVRVYIYMYSALNGFWIKGPAARENSHPWIT